MPMKILILLFASFIFIGLLINDAYRVPSPPKAVPERQLTKQTVQNFNYSQYPVSMLAQMPAGTK
ncbi:hypothetical protein BH24BAC1_BH24BAC1_20370 [soil metagenome]